MKLSKIALWPQTTTLTGDNNGDDQKADCTAAATPYQEPLPCHLCGKPALKKLSQHLKLTYHVEPKVERDRMMKA